jgi:hypothetical protein
MVCLSKPACNLHVHDVDFVDENRKFPLIAVDVYSYLRQYSVSLYKHIFQIAMARLTALWLREFLKRIYYVVFCTVASNNWRNYRVASLTV